jgi:Predicted AAA-ATPase
MVFQNRSHLFFPANAQFSNFFKEPSAIVADKTHFIPLLEENPFEYMFLRPRRWGKSTFLNMLATYYDIMTKDSFKEIFGGLDIGKTPTKSCNSHLILLFDFSSIRVGGSFEDIKQSIFYNVSGSLRRFLFKYRDIFGDVLLDKYIIPGETGNSLMNVLVSKFGTCVCYHTKRNNRISFTEMDIPLSLVLMNMMPRLTLVW